MQNETRYLCPSCGEEIIIPVDLSAGRQQKVVEDCPVCCHPNVLQIDVDEDGEIRCQAESE